ncbi:hypothetical protein [Plantactinospora sp. BB1]|uniref:hypothetical protein n=1 Tax=Plantactinospora sp. BB1 TaxID=2071627 RepID=UPI000D177B67|nr:hypothetical protein [Plantactinospora sp. BB1]AVT39270.1 hypothetical protein C6W10_25710 [Plantactinospora sp. BB1]
MGRIRLRFASVRFALGAALLSVSAGVARLETTSSAASSALFAAGLMTLATGVASIESRSVVVHDRWDYGRIHRALEKAPEDAVIRIQQTWFPEENFVAALCNLYLQQHKRFALRVLLMDPGEERDPPPDLLAARVRLRGISATASAEKIRSTMADLVRLKQMVHDDQSGLPGSGRRAGEVDLEIRLYDFLPFGPIYQIGDEVMFVGFYVNHGTSSAGPMLEIRNSGRTALWRQFAQNFDYGWRASQPRRHHPAP